MVWHHCTVRLAVGTRLLWTCSWRKRLLTPPKLRWVPTVHQLHVSLVVLKNEIKALWVVIPLEQTFCCTWHADVEQWNQSTKGKEYFFQNGLTPLHIACHLKKIKATCDISFRMDWPRCTWQPRVTTWTVRDSCCTTRPTWMRSRWYVSVYWPCAVGGCTSLGLDGKIWHPGEHCSEASHVQRHCSQLLQGQANNVFVSVDDQLEGLDSSVTVQREEISMKRQYGEDEWVVFLCVCELRGGGLK